MYWRRFIGISIEYGEDYMGHYGNVWLQDGSGKQ
mgnify:FL=1